MRIDPADVTPVESAVPHEIHNIAVRHGGCLVHLLIVRQQLRPATPVPDEELSVNERMATHFVATQKRVELCSMRPAIR